MMSMIVINRKGAKSFDLKSGLDQQLVKHCRVQNQFSGELHKGSDILFKTTLTGFHRQNTNTAKVNQLLDQHIIKTLLKSKPVVDLPA